MKLSTLIAAATVAAFATGAQASIEKGTDSSIGNGELIFAAWDTAAQKSYLLDTGIRFNDIKANLAANVPTLFQVDAVFNTFFGAATSNLVWNLYAGSNNIAGDYSDMTNYGAITTVANKAAGLSLKYDFNGLDALVNGVAPDAITKTQNAALDAIPTSTNRSYTVTSPTAPSFLGTSLGWGSYGGLTANTTAVKSGESSYAYLNGGFLDENFDFQTTATFIGRATFDASTGQGRINTPVPAAAWLLVSGLAGFGAISRRRKQQA